MRLREGITAARGHAAKKQPWPDQNLGFLSGQLMPPAAGTQSLEGWGADPAQGLGSSTNLAQIKCRDSRTLLLLSLFTCS